MKTKYVIGLTALTAVLFTVLTFYATSWWLSYELGSREAELLKQGDLFCKQDILARIDFDTKLYGMSCWETIISDEGRAAGHVEYENWPDYFMNGSKSIS